MQLGSQCYKIWYPLFTCPDARRWPNHINFVLTVNWKSKQMLSSLKALKTDRRTALSNDTLNDFPEVYIQGPPLSSFNADAAIKLWWQVCSSGRRPISTLGRSTGHDI